MQRRKKGRKRGDVSLKVGKKKNPPRQRRLVAAAARLNELEVFPEAHEKGPRRARHWLHCAASGRANACNHSHFYLLSPRKCACNGAGNETRLRVRVAAASPPCADVPGAWPWDGRGVKTGQNREKENTFFNKNKIRCVKSCLQQLKCIVKILYMGTEEAGGGVEGCGVGGEGFGTSRGSILQSF